MTRWVLEGMASLLFRRGALDPMRALLVFVALFLPVSALSNGAPIVSDPVVGAPVLRQETSIRLRSEELDLRLLTGVTYSATATYHLENSGPPATIAYAVPIAFELETARAVDSEAAADGALAKTAASVRLTIADRTVTCRLLPPEPSGDTIWCVASLRVPAGSSSLRLSYSSSLAYAGGSSSKSPFDYLSDSTLRYDLAPAGHWAGPTERVQVTLHASGLADRVVVTSPQGWRRAGDAFTLTLRDVDLKSAPPIVATVRTEARHFHEQAVSFGKLSGVATARASSTLNPQGKHRYDPANVLDGDPATAWCEGAPGAGPGEWIEVRLPASAARCPLHGFLLTPGYVRDDASWTRNARPVKVRLDACDALGQGPVGELKLPERFDESAVVLDGPPFPEAPAPEDDASPEQGTPLCARLTIVEVQRGRDDDACLSEFRPVFNCN